MLWTAFFLGLAGSLHCVVMCGPLMLAFPLPLAEKIRMLVATLSYQVGRISTYALLGLFFGLLGKGLAMAGLQRGLSIGAGILMIAAAFSAFSWESAALKIPGVQAATQWVQKRIASLLRHNPSGASFGVGVLNGFIPCGLVYAALAGAITTTDAWTGGVYMLVFGLGTLPLLFVLMLSGQRIGASIRARFRIVQPMLLAITGILLLSRGLHLDLSLFNSAVPPANLECH